MKVALLGSLVSILALAVTGCSSDTASEGSSRCQALREPALEYLQAMVPSGLDDPVYVPDPDGTYFIAAMVDGEPALWGMSDLDSGVVWSVNQHAADVSQIGRSRPITGDDDGAAEALLCVESS